VGEAFDGSNAQGEDAHVQRMRLSVPVGSLLQILAHSQDSAVTVVRVPSSGLDLLMMPGKQNEMVNCSHLVDAVQ
jgi:hypothetical protein